MISYWEQQSLIKYDYIIIGSGIVGISTAIELKETYPNKTVLILERGLLPTGASTRNAGFACMGSVTELLDDLQHSTEEEVVSLFERRKKGLSILRNRLGDDNIGYAHKGSYELISNEEVDALSKIDYLNQLLLSINKKETFALANDKIATFKFNTNKVKALIENKLEGELHTGKMMASLINYAISKGIEIKTGAHVSNFEDTNNKVKIYITNSVDSLIFQCTKLFICTNAFSKALLTDIDVTPGRGQVLITKPINDLPFHGIFHFDKGYYYFRRIEDRILFGGGRNLDFETEATTEIELNIKIQDDLEHKLRTIILPNIENINIDLRWSGIMAFGKNKQPLISCFSENVFGALRLGGMGVALGSLVAKDIVALSKI